jgi:hypothetical protein
LKHSIEESDLVLRGRVIKVEGPVEGKMRGFIQVDRVIKGELQGDNIEMDFTSFNPLKSMDRPPDILTPKITTCSFLRKKRVGFSVRPVLSQVSSARGQRG